jgi:hypothetical protein
VANKPGHRGELEAAVKTIARGMPDVSGVTVVTNACAFYHCARGCGRAERPAFPAPLLGEEFMQNSGAWRCESAAAYAELERRHYRMLGCLKFESEIRTAGGLLQRAFVQHLEHQLHGHQHGIVAARQFALSEAAEIIDQRDIERRFEHPAGARCDGA